MTTKATRATSKASAIANRLRQIRDRSHPATRARSAAPRGRAKTDALVRARRLPAHSPTQISDSSHYDAMRAICVRATSGRVPG